MTTRHRLPRLALLALLLAAIALVATGCGKKKESTADSTTAASAAECQKDKLDLFKAGQLTVATDDPAYSPYFEDNDPSNGKGFESAVAYAIAGKLGFSDSEVKWTVVPFNSSYAPGEKKFDFDVNQISKNADREKAVSFSSTYYTTPQAVVVPKGSSFAGATTLADLKDAEIGVQVGTTSLDAVNDQIKPSKTPKVFNDSNDVVQALKNDSVDAVVVDLPTALYLTAAEIPTAKVVGQFSAPGGDNWGAVLAKDSSLTKCVSWAIDELRASGELQKITDQYLGGDTVRTLS
ncbi:MAG: ABC transporter substrate-binding protein [Solirubrobacterales bacterium]